MGGKRACDEGDGMVCQRGHDKDGAGAAERASTRARRIGLRRDRDGDGAGVAKNVKTQMSSLFV